MINDYSARRCWLQEHALSHPGIRLNIAEGVDDTVKNEAVAGLIRLFGEGIIKDDAAFTINIGFKMSLGNDAFLMGMKDGAFSLLGADHAGLLYALYRLFARLAAGSSFEDINEKSVPACPIRGVHHWDNIDGTVERGYAGGSIFFDGGKLSYSPERVRDYARLLASIGINTLTINNVNVTPESAMLITEKHLPDIAELAKIFREYHIKLGLCIHFDSPMLIGGLPVSDPMDKAVAEWWKKQTDIVYSYVSDLAGFWVKADSEFQGGPSSLGRTQAEGANVIAKALKGHGGVLFWRCFIYNCRQDWRDAKTDRPMAAYQEFTPLDGQFEKNVILQIKNGPVDFQVREPVSPLFKALERTNEALELQITQEYTGQQIDLFSLATMWEEVLRSPVSAAECLRDLCGKRILAMEGVSNVGLDDSWTGHILAQANLYAFGRLAWNPKLKADDIVDEWVRQSFGSEETVVANISSMMKSSSEVYEKYTAPLGIGWMVNPGSHYGPNVDGYEFSKWGTYHRADTTMIGVDRTSRGTGFTTQYNPYLTKLYDDPETCPEKLLLFFHRLRYDHRLKSGKTLIQHIYDTHFEGADAVEAYITLWESMSEILPDELYTSVLERLQLQLKNAREWRDVINTYFRRRTGVADRLGRYINP